MLYCHLLIHAEIYIHMLDTYRRNGKRRRKTSLTKYLPLTLFVEVYKGVTPKFACERELETAHYWNILTPKVMAVSVVSVSFSRAAHLKVRAPENLAFGRGYRELPVRDHRSTPTSTWATTASYHSTVLNCLVLFQLSRRSYIIFKLPRGDTGYASHASAISSDIWRSGCVPFRYLWNGPVWSLSSGYNCHAVQRVTLYFG